MSDLRLSHSQVSTILTCSVQHRIERRFKKKGRPHWSTIGGSAFHKMAELELLQAHGVNAGEVPEVEDALDEALAAALQDSDYVEADIRVSKTLPRGWSKTVYPNGADRQFLTDAIPVWLASWRLWLSSLPYSLWFLPDGSPALEVELDFELGGHPVKGFVDAILVHNETGDLLPVDYKAGARHIEGDQQLGTYKVGIEEKFGLPVSMGAFFYAREGAAVAKDLRHWSKERLDVIYRHAGAIIENGLYVPNFSSCEYMCSVRDYCGYVGGKWSDQVPLPGEDTPLLEVHVVQ